MFLFYYYLLYYKRFVSLLQFTVRFTDKKSIYDFYYCTKLLTDGGVCLLMCLSITQKFQRKLYSYIRTYLGTIVILYTVRMTSLPIFILCFSLFNLNKRINCAPYSILTNFSSLVVLNFLQSSFLFLMYRYCRLRETPALK